MEESNPSKAIKADLYHRKTLAKKSPSSSSLRLMSYNILANVHVEPHMFPDNTPDEMDFENRLRLINSEIEAVKPDILCIQELEEKEEQRFSSIPSLASFDRVYQPRADHDTIKPKIEGSAVFFSKNRFSLLKKHRLTLKMIKEIYPRTDAFSSEMIKSCAASLLILETKEGDPLQRTSGSKTRLAVLSTHLPFTVTVGHVKFASIILIMKVLRELRKVYDFSDFFICGDFNLIPCSMLYDFLVSGSLDLNIGVKDFSMQRWALDLHKEKEVREFLKDFDRKRIPSSETKQSEVSEDFYRILLDVRPIIDEGELIRFSPPEETSSLDLSLVSEAFRELSKSMGFRSSYAEVKNSVIRSQNQSSLSPDSDQPPTHNEISYSHFTKKMTLPIDFVFFHSQGTLEPISVLDVPDLEWMIEQDKGCPFGPFGSDHISLVVDFELKDHKTDEAPLPIDEIKF